MVEANNEDVAKKAPAKKRAVKQEEAKDVGLLGSIKGRIVSDGVDHLHPEDLARYELFRVKKEVAVAKKTILQKEEQIMLLKLRHKQQELEIKKLEYQVKNQQLVQLNDDADDGINIATQDFKKFGQELAETYDLDPDNLIYDDMSGKLVDV